MNDKIHKAQLFILSLTAFVFPLYIKLTSIGLLLAFIIAFANKDSRIAILSLLKDFRFYLFISPVIFAIAGLALTKDIFMGLNIIEVLSSIVLFPFIFKSFSTNKYNRKYQWINTWFILGLLTSFAICISTSSISFFETGKSHHFFYTYLSDLIMLPNQLSIYVLWGIVLLLLDIIEKERQFTFFAKPLVKILTISILLIFLFLLSSKAAVIIFTAIVFTIMLSVILKHRIPFWQSILIILALSISTAYLFNATSIKSRVQVAIDVLLKDKSTYYGLGESTNLRLTSLKASYHLIKSHPLTGVGTGNLGVSLIDQYKYDGVPINYMHQTNPHNQLVYSFAMNGIIGLLAILSMFFAMFFVAWKKRQRTLFFWSIIMFLFFLSDDLLMIQVGVVFFSFYSSLLMWGEFTKKPIK